MADADGEADVVVVGLGPGGEDVAGRLAEAGLEVVGIDGGLVGGECPYWGCIPSKMMIRAADLIVETRRAATLAGTTTIEPSWELVARRIREEATDSWDDRVAVERLEAKGCRFIRGWARLVANDRVTVGDRSVRARRALVVNPGTRPAAPPLPGLEHTPYWTNRQAIETEEVPPRLAVLGGGAIGCELAQVFSRFGSKVMVLEAADRLLGPEEPESGALLAEVFAEEGIDVRTGVAVGSVAHDGRLFTLSLGGGEPVVVEGLLVATGRRPDLAALGVAAVGLEETARSLPVDDHLRVVGVPGMWALGDVTGHGQFTHISMYQADIVVNDVLGRPVVPADYRALPRVTFTDPEIGAVGLTEREAREAGLDVRTGFTDLPSSARGFIHDSGLRGFVKLVEDSARGVLVGGTTVGPSGGEMLGLLSVAVHAEVTTQRLRHMIYAYPTFHRAIEAAVVDLLGS
ncbi:MAG TPA: NAD(P)/FAD-dependent oxidoreductase [Acidimicrobiales bacterium]|nr:NAD(P)/FAD-dependent oxidoreductase [Acidimicrobiales bacterium]